MTSACWFDVLLEARKSVEHAKYLLQISTEYFCHQVNRIHYISYAGWLIKKTFQTLALNYKTLKQK